MEQSPRGSALLVLLGVVWLLAPAGLVLAVPVLASVERVAPGSASPVHQGGIGRQEHSGGDTRCPGG